MRPHRCTVRSGGNWEYYDPFLPNPLPGGNYILQSDDWLGAAHGAHARSFYRAPAYGTTWWAFIYFLTDLLDTCPVRRISLATQTTTYSYLSTHILENDEGSQPARCAHGEDMVLL
jgi:hypothetical protein